MLFKIKQNYVLKGQLSSVQLQNFANFGAFVWIWCP